MDDFGVKYVGKEHVNHLIECLQEKYELTKDWMGDLYCGIKLIWDYTARTLNISMPGYIKKLLHKYKHKMAKKPQHCQYTPAPKQYGADAQAPLPNDISPKLSADKIKEIQRIIGSILYYARAVNSTILMALSSIASEQMKGTTNAMDKAKQLLDYLATHPDVTIRFQASDMILNIHSKALYLSEANAQKPCLQPFLYGMGANRQGPHQIEWSIFYIMHHPTFCGGISG